MFGFTRAKELYKKTKLIRLLISAALLTGSLYGSYTIWWKEKVIATALETPEGREALARALIETRKPKATE